MMTYQHINPNDIITDALLIVFPIDYTICRLVT